MKIIFLEIPLYSIRKWNETKGHPNPDCLFSHDLALYERLSLVNDYIKQVNEKINMKSQRFRLDLRRTRKSKTRSNYRRVGITFSGYKDGIHPEPLLARCWLKELLNRCWATVYKITCFVQISIGCRACSFPYGVITVIVV